MVWPRRWYHRQRANHTSKVRSQSPCPPWQIITAAQDAPAVVACKCDLLTPTAASLQPAGIAEVYLVGARVLSGITAATGLSSADRLQQQCSDFRKAWESDLRPFLQRNNIAVLCFPVPVDSFLTCCHDTFSSRARACSLPPGLVFPSCLARLTRRFRCPLPHSPPRKVARSRLRLRCAASVSSPFRTPCRRVAATTAGLCTAAATIMHHRRTFG